MHVKKFEARTMKEALEMVKTHLGPDAIILSAKDNNKSFGLIGEGSVEITAAVAQSTMHKKQFVESKLRAEDKEKLLRSPAKQQKIFINSMVDKYVQKKSAPAQQASNRESMHDLSGGGVTTSFRSQEKAKGEPKPITSQKYIDIDNDHQEDERSHENIRQAVMRARNAFNDNDEVVNNRNENSNAPKESSFGSKLFKKQAVALPQIQETTQASNQELDYLREEIKNLKSVLTNFKEIPQTFSGTFPGAGFGIPFEMSYMFEKLTHTGMAPEVVSEILREGQREIGPSRISNKALVEAFVARYILNHVKVADTAHQDKIQIFMGVAGAGKTSSLIKFASHLVVHEGKKVALLTADTQKVGAAEQLKIFAQILNVPFGIIRSVEDWNMIIKQLAKFDHILVDFPSSSLKTEAEVQRMRNLLPPRSVKTTNHLVMNALKKDFDSTEIGKRYRSFNYEDVIFTALDESHTHGTIYNFIHRFQVPVHSFGMGVRIPEDFEMGSAERILDLIFKITHEGQV